MYNCARLATLFDTYQRAVERGEHQPHCPPPTAAPGMELQGLPGHDSGLPPPFQARTHLCHQRRN